MRLRGRSPADRPRSVACARERRNADGAGRTNAGTVSEPSAILRKLLRFRASRPLIPPRPSCRAHHRCAARHVKPIRKIGVLTGGGDAPGLNAVIRAVVKAACNTGIEVIGLEDSFDGLLELNRSRVLTTKDVTGILRRGGTILGTVNTRRSVRPTGSTTSEGVEQTTPTASSRCSTGWGSTRWS